MLYGHGGDRFALARRLGWPPGRIVDFSSNVSPLPLPSCVREEIARSLDEIRFLPEVDSFSLRARLARRYGLTPDHFVINAGTTPWIFALPSIFSPDIVITFSPTYSDYRDGAVQAGIPVKTVSIMDESGLHREGNEVFGELEMLARGKKALIYLCNPNNPTGYYISPKEIARFASSIDAESMVVVDESYAPFIDEDRYSSLIPRLDHTPNIMVLRSFSKIYGVPGIRLGYLCGVPDMAGVVKRSLTPWAVGSIAQTAAILLAGMEEFEQEVREYCRSQKEWLVSEIGRLPGMKVVRGAAHFFMIRVTTGASRRG